ncbi:unnamed protein product (macronuclear) [Paramecium tetraurelia]|uniref:Uncharacterized protein n=1 Tax=Paramecium tetraurelia TaxID=5888 RepID=A0D0H3_PARTE|nr:uncharacterized protein GSPATT00012092001 [Paramecium tetraurelia]CAK76540.1 unnamed protein product [Paramecium tetraurelia]|eukprot:XP_001443937.1 hypothetical protein (macronuclear) [Paramecium tetraurelia strain d4-2]
MELQTTLRSYLSSFETYSHVRDIKLRVLYGDKMHIKIVQQSLAAFLVDEEESPILRLLALKVRIKPQINLQFNKELAETFNEDYIHLMQKIVLPKMEQIAQFKKESQDSDRGKLFFLGKQKPHQGNQELQALGDQFFRVTLECIRIWGRWFPLDKQHHRLSLYRVAYERLYKIGVHFPEIQYFDLHQVHSNLPSTFPPLSMVQQLKRVMSIHLRSTTKEICRYLESHLPEEYHQTQYSSFAELFQTIVKKHILNKNKQARIANIFLEKEYKLSESKKQDDKEEWTQLQRLQIENQQLQQLNNMYQSKMQELQKQIILTQNQNTLLQQQIQDKQLLIEKLETDWKNIEKKFLLLFEEYKKTHDSKNPFVLAQFEKQLAEFKIEFGLSYKEVDCFKLRAENEYLIKQLEEQEDLFNKVKHEKEVLLTENRLLMTKLNNLSQKSIKGDKFEPEPPQDVGELKFYKQKSNLVQYEQIMISQKQQITQLKNQLLQMNDKKNSVTSQTWGISTKSNSRRNINILQADNIQSSKQCEVQNRPYRQSKIIMPPIIDYDPTIFAINPSIFNTRFRQACFTSKSIIHQDDKIQINTTTQLKIQVLFVTLTIQNKSSMKLNNLSLKLQNTEQLYVKVLNNINRVMNPEESQIIQIQIEIKEIPFSILEAQLIYMDKIIEFGIPCTINKFLNYSTCQQLPATYFYQCKPFLTGFQSSIPNLLQEFEIVSQSENEVSMLAQVEYQKEEYEIMISCRKSMMSIKINGGYNDRLIKTIISTYQGLFLKR